ncbi:hypothetical protein [Corynebacterium halotolerans]|uniref:hypothetical protein n=1 Tax=Corynebacterium halotolerans TaxID=225326 RepID=UPI003CF44AAD
MSRHDWLCRHGGRRCDETWEPDHPDRGHLRVHIGPDVLLRDLDPGFPVAEEPADGGGQPAMGTRPVR